MRASALDGVVGRAARDCKGTLPPNSTLPPRLLAAFVRRGQAAVQRADTATLLDLATSVAECYNGTEWAMGHTAQVPEEMAAIRSVLSSRQRSAWRTLCEVGFNAGHSAILWLQQTPAHLVEFDAGILAYHRGSRAFLEAVYPGRASFHIGNSKETFFAHAAMVASGNHAPCDLSFIDGMHRGRLPGRDMKNAITSSNTDPLAWMFADDCSSRFPDVKRAFRQIATDSIEANYTRRWLVKPPPAGLKGWCFGRVRASAVQRARERHRRGLASFTAP